jgi:hypothetical protein
MQKEQIRPLQNLYLGETGALDLTLNWKPETELMVADSDDEISSHMLVGSGVKVHVIAAGESWPVKEVKSVLKEG